MCGAGWIATHLVPAVRLAGAWQAWQTVTMWAMAARQFHISVTIWQRVPGGGFAVMELLGLPAVFTPAHHGAQRHLDILWCAHGYTEQVLGSAGPAAIGSANGSQLKGDHFALLLPSGSAAPPPYTLEGSRAMREWPNPAHLRGDTPPAAEAALSAAPSGKGKGTTGRRSRRGSGKSTAAAPTVRTGTEQQPQTANGKARPPKRGAPAGAARNSPPVAPPRDQRRRLVTPAYDSVGDERLAAVLDSVTTDTLVKTRFFTSANALRSSTQRQQWRLLMEFAAEQWKGALYSCVEAAQNRHNGEGGRRQSVQAAQQMAVRAYKFMHLLPPLVFGRLDSTSHKSVADRLQTTLSGDIHDLMAAVLKEAHPSAGAPTQQRGAAHDDAHNSDVEARPPPLTEPDSPWTPDDDLLHGSCARLSGQRNGVGLAARRLEQREARAPANETTLAALRAKHPPTGARTHVQVNDTEHAVVQQQAAAARARRVHAMPTAAILKDAGSAPQADKRFAAAKEAAGTNSGSGSGNPYKKPAQRSPWPPPNAPTEQEAEDGPKPPLTVSAGEIEAALRAAGAGKAAGLDGLRFEHLWVASGTSATAAAADDEHRFGHCPTDPNGVREHGCLLAKHLAAAYTVLLGAPEIMPEESWRLFRAAALTAVGDKRRPIAVSSVWRRLLGSTVSRSVKLELAAKMEERSQYGFGVPAGVEHVAMEARVWHEMGGTIVQLDCENAFNSVDRAAIVHGLEHYCPLLLPLFQALYCGNTPPELRVALQQYDGAAEDGVRIILAHLGCQQGDPLGPLWFAVAATYLLHQPDGVRDGEQLQAGRPPPPPPHCAFLDDLNLRLPPAFDNHAAAQVELVVRRLAEGGLRVRPDKSAAIAMHGRVFDSDERRRLDRLSIPYVDATALPADRGFTSVGVPIGEQAYVCKMLDKRLFDPPMWRFAWHLAGMARKDLQAALRIFSGSFTRRFVYLTRNVDPDTGAPYFGGFDGLCAWTFDRILHLHGAAAASDMRAFLNEACNAGNATAAANAGPLRLPQLCPAHLVWPAAAPDATDTDLPMPRLPLAIGRLPVREGGRGLPQLHLVCYAAFAAQARETLPARLRSIAQSVGATGDDGGGGAAKEHHNDSDDGGVGDMDVDLGDNYNADDMDMDLDVDHDVDTGSENGGTAASAVHGPVDSASRTGSSKLNATKPRAGTGSGTDSTGTLCRPASGLELALAPAWEGPLPPVLVAVRAALRWLVTALPADTPAEAEADGPATRPAGGSKAASTTASCRDAAPAGSTNLALGKAAETDGAATATGGTHDRQQTGPGGEAAAAPQGSARDRSTENAGGSIKLHGAVGSAGSPKAGSATSNPDEPVGLVQCLFPALMDWINTADDDPDAAVSSTGDILSLLASDPFSAPAPAEPTCASVREVIAKATRDGDGSQAAAVAAAGDNRTGASRADSFDRGTGGADPASQSRQGEEQQRVKAQKILTRALIARQSGRITDLLRDLGRPGRAALAQLRSQRGSGALSGLTAAPGVAHMHSMAVATVMLNALFVDAWGVQPRAGRMCPYDGCENKLNHCGGPTTAHAMSCTHQHHRGYNATHTTQKRCLQKLLRDSHVTWIANEDGSMFNRADRKADTVVWRGAMHMASDKELQHMGVILDTTIRCPVAALYLKPAKRSAATEDGYAAKKGEKEKRAHHKGALDETQWRFVPFAQETFGRLGPAARDFLGDLAEHSAVCKGGDSVTIRRRSGIIMRSLIVRLSASLHAELAERVFAYVRGARMKGWVVRPVSAHLHTITPRAADDTPVPPDPIAPPP